MEKISGKTNSDYIREAYRICKCLGYFSYAGNYAVLKNMINVLRMAEFTHDATKSKLWTWKTNCMRYELIKQLKKHKRDKLRFCGKKYNIVCKKPAFVKTFVSNVPNQYNVVLVNEIIDFVNTSDDVSSEHKQIFNMWFLNHEPQVEIAAKLKVSKQRVWRLIDNLKNIIKEKFHD